MGKKKTTKAAKTTRSTASKGGRTRRHAGTEDTRIRRFATETARLLHDRHFTEVLMLDVRGKSDVTDYIVIGSGTSDRQIRSVAQEVADLGKESQMVRYGQEEDGPATWSVVDFVDVVVHLFEPATRSHYDLEMLWGDAPRVRWQRRGK